MTLRAGMHKGIFACVSKPDKVKNLMSRSSMPTNSMESCRARTHECATDSAGNANKGPPSGSLKSRFFRQGAQMVFWRILALGFGAAGSIWAARCLGPENMGISGMIMATTGQAVLLIELNQNALLVRNYAHITSEGERSDLISSVFTFRLFLCSAMILVAIPILLIADVPAIWHIGIIASIPLLFFSCNMPVWVLQAQQNMPANYKAIAIPSVISAILYFTLFLPGIGPGSDVIVQSLAQACAFVLGWYFALKGRHLRLVQWRTLARVWPLLKEGRWLMLTGLVFYVYTNFDAPLLGYLRPLNELGQYRSATKLVAVSQSFLFMIPLLLYPRLIEWNKIGADFLWRKQRQILIGAVCIIAPLSVVVFLLSPMLYRLTYGPAFQIAATPFAILLTSKLLGVIRDIFCWGLWAQKEDKKVTGLVAVSAAISLLLNFILIPRQGMLAAAWINLISETIILIGAFCMARANGAHKPPQEVPASAV